MVEKEEAHDDGGEEGDEERDEQQQVSLEPVTPFQRNTTPEGGEGGRVREEEEGEGGRKLLLAPYLTTPIDP